MNLHNTEYKRNFIDQETGAKIVIDNSDAYVNRGKAFKLTQFNPALADNGYIYFEIKTPPNNAMHLNNIRVWADDEPITIELIENPTLTTGTVAIIPVNKNRTPFPIWTIFSEVIVKANPTGISAGIPLDKVQILQLTDKWLLPAGNKLFLIRIQNLSGGPVMITARIQWYE